MIIGLTGCARSGKDTVADYLVDRHGFQKQSIAAPLKQICQLLFDWTDEQTYGEEKDLPLPHTDTGIRPREIMQFIGTELFRERIGERFPELGGNVWIDHLVRTALRDTSKAWVIPDVRFPNEARRIRDHGGWIVRVESSRGTRIVDDAHVSESVQSQIDPDYTLYNRADKEYLYAQIRLFLHRFDHPNSTWSA